MGTIQRQGIINTVIIYIGVALGFLNRILIQPHYLTPEEVGLSGLLISFSGFLTVFFSLGASSMCLRFFPFFKNKGPGHHGFLGFLLLFPLTGVIAGGIIILVLKSWLISTYIDKSPLFADYFFWVWPLAAVMTFSIALNAYASSLFKTTVISFLNDVWVRVVLIAFTFAYSFAWIDFNWFVAGIGLTYISQTVFLVIYIQYIDGIRLKINWAFVSATIGLKNILRFTGLMTLTAISTLSLRFLDAIMIGAYVSEKAVGVYAIGAFIAQFIETPLNSLERIGGVKIAHAFEANNLGEVRDIYYKSVRYLFLVGGFVGLCIITCIYDLLKLLPEAYHDAATITIIASIGSVFNMATGINTPIINNSSKYFWNLIFLFTLLVVAVIMNMLLIPRYGIAGAAIATVIASTIFNLMKFLFIWKHFKMQPYDMQTFKTIFVIGITGLAVWILPVQQSAWVAILLKGSVAGVVYLSFTFMLRIVPEYNKLLWDKLKRK